MKLKLWGPSLVSLANSFSVNPDSCSNPDFFQLFIRFSAVTDQNSGRGVTHAIISDEEDELYGFVTLKNTALMTSSTTGEPALEIMNLAVSAQHERRGIGKMLIDTSVAIANLVSGEYSAIRYLVLASDPKSVSFYEHMGFHRFMDYWALPRETTNQDCVPMFLQIHN